MNDVDASSEYLDQVEAQLVALTARGVKRRRPPGLRAEVLALAVAVVVVLAVVVVALGTLRSSRGGGAGPHRGVHSAAPGQRGAGHGAQAAPGTSGAGASALSGGAPGGAPGGTPAGTAGHGPASGPVPAGFEPQSFTAISELTWWVMGTAPCSQPPCTSIVRTTDGGVSFVGIPAPRAPWTSSASAGGVSQLRFADAENGFAYGGALFVTHDAGRTWRALDLGGAVDELAIAAGRTYAIVAPPGGGERRLMSALVGQDAWTVVSAAGAVADSLWARGNDVFVQPTDRGDVLVSHDQGIQFARYPSPSPGLGCDFEELAPRVVWAHCPTGTLSSVWRSTDGGATFQLAAGGTPGIGGIGGLANSAAFAAASATTAVVGDQQLYRTADGGESYTPTTGPTGITSWQYLGFTDATHGVALGAAGSQERLYYTTDGGASYHAVAIH
jgi:hypothetical protein